MKPCCRKGRGHRAEISVVSDATGPVLSTGGAGPERRRDGMISKRDAAARITEAGYPAEVENGVVVIRDPLNRRRQRDVVRILKEIGYHASFGWMEAGKNEC